MPGAPREESVKGGSKTSLRNQGPGLSAKRGGKTSGSKIKNLKRKREKTNRIKIRFQYAKWAPDKEVKR